MKKDLFHFFDKPKDPLAFDSIKISLTSPEKILEWSCGEVKKPETINYRTFKPEKDGLFCAKIFGPVKDYECNCGKYKRMKHRGIVCEKCGVEVIQSKVRRERLGHISLASPVAHIWFLKSLPSRIGNVLDVTLKDLEKVLYCEAYIIIDPLKTTLRKGGLLSEDKFQEAIEEFGFDSFIAGMGAEAVRNLLVAIDVKELSSQLRKEMKEAQSEAKRKKLSKRLRIVDSFAESGNKPEWMMLTDIPVIPPDLRPLVPLDGGRFATSDLNDLYRRVINRNNRLKRLLELSAPEIIIRNEKRMLQEATDALFDNGRRGKVITGPNKRPLKSLSDMLKGKQGRFRQNLLGKRVDYSGRSVIVVGPELKLQQCGLPKQMAIELFKPFIYNKLVDNFYVTTIKSAKKMVEKECPEVWDMLEEVIKEHPILLNRAPTLHRLGIQAFEPILIEGKAIQLHPLVCAAFNADFDGDQMAVHIPLSLEAQMEARVLMMSTNNILSPAHGKPIINPTQDIVLGIYYMTRENPLAKGAKRKFYGIEDVRIAYDNDLVELQAPIEVIIDGSNKKTTVGRALLAEILPEGVEFELVDKVMNKGALAELIDRSYRKCGQKATVLLADRLRTLGFYHSTRAGISISISNMTIPSKKQELLDQAYTDIKHIEQQYADGIITDGEKHNKLIDNWTLTTDNVAAQMMRELEVDILLDNEGKEHLIPSFNPIFIMADSGARGSAQQIKQLAGMRGLMVKPSGEIIETPITANFREGLSVLQYFISTHGARKGLADTALKTANSGYLTRRLVDVAQDCTVTEFDCETLDGIYLSSLVEGGEIIQPMGERILGRTALDDIVEPYTNEVIVEANQQIDEDHVQKIEASGIERVHIRSVLTCQAERGICAQCYGRDLSRGHKVNIGEAVGVIAAQSIGEPGTQLTMRTFHIGGAVQGRAEQSTLENRYSGFVKYDNLHVVAKQIALDEGSQKQTIWVVMNRNGEITILDEHNRERERYPVVYGAQILIPDGGKVKTNTMIAQWDPFSTVIITEVSGYVAYGDILDGLTMEEQTDPITGLTQKVIAPSKDSDMRPTLSVKDADGNTLKLSLKDMQNREIEASYLLPVGANILVQDKEFIKAGDVLAKIPRETTKTKDITGGLPRVAELFEARKPKEHAQITEIDGIVSFGKDTKGKRKIIVTPEIGEPKEYLISKQKYIRVQEGDFVRTGDPLMDGSSNPHDILRVMGEKELAKYLVDEVQEVYRLQGVKINDKHIEVIVRQMLRRVKITDVGDTNLLLEDQVEKQNFKKINEAVMGMEEASDPAEAESLLLGITKASLSTDSFISASSFQETTKVLTEAAIAGKVDNLLGLKENVIMGRLIPAGTGLPVYHKLNMAVEGFDQDQENDKELTMAQGETGTELAEQRPPEMPTVLS